MYLSRIAVVSLIVPCFSEKTKVQFLYPNGMYCSLLTAKRANLLSLNFAQKSIDHNVFDIYISHDVNVHFILSFVSINEDNI